ncbi:MAG: hypothetical protein IJ835_07215 [Muribaculaceae bacterium]|nr:hypothetical protein [Muribaculaceae bacterium]
MTNFTFFTGLKGRIAAVVLLACYAMSVSAQIVLEEVIPDANFRLFLRKSAYAQNETYFEQAKTDRWYPWKPSEEYGENPLDKDEWTSKEFQVIQVLDLSAATEKVSNLTGIDRFYRLTQLNLSGHNLSGTINLDYNSSLQQIDLSNNAITGLTVSSWTSSLTSINITGNQIKKAAMLEFIESLFDRANPANYYSYSQGTIITAYDDANTNECDEQVAVSANIKGWTIKDGTGNEFAPPIHLANVIEDENFRWYLRRIAYDHNKYNFKSDVWQPSGDYSSPEKPLDKDTWTVQEFRLIKELKMNPNNMGTRKVKSLNGINLFPNVNNLYCTGQQLTEVDLRSLKRLINLDLSDNQITSIQVPKESNVGGIKNTNISGNNIKIGEMMTICYDMRTCNQSSSPTPIFKIRKANAEEDGNEITPYAVFMLTYKWYTVQDANGASLYDYAFTPFELEDYISDKNLVAYLREQAYTDNESWINNYRTYPSDWWWSKDEGRNYLNSVSSNMFNKEEWNSMDIFMLRRLYLNRWNADSLGTDSKLITDLSGIKQLEMLEELKVGGHKLETLDVSYMPNLRLLHCDNQKSASKLTELNVEGCESLYQLYCDNNDLSDIDVSTLESLKMIRCNNNPKMTRLDFSNSPKLNYVDCFNCSLEELNLTKNPELATLYCYENRDNEVDGPAATRRGKLTNLDLSNNPKLTELRCSNLPLTDLHLENNQNLEKLYVNNIDLSGGKLQKNLMFMPNLQELSCFADTLDALDVSDNHALTKLICYRNQIEKLDLSNNVELVTLNCGENQWHPSDGDEANVDERRVPLPYGGNRLMTLDVSKNTKLQTLSCAQNFLTDLDLRGLTALTSLNYAEQERTIQAEMTHVHGKNLYYLRMDENLDDNEYILKTRIAESNTVDGTSQFDISLVDMTSWSNGVTLNGTKTNSAGAPRMRAVATVGDVNPDYVIGNILVLTNVKETATDATGTVTYKYNVPLDESVDPAIDQHTDFTLHWTANPKVPTGIDDIATTLAPAVKVEYYNTAGLKSDVPFDGINIVVTTHADGTVSTVKRLK